MRVVGWAVCEPKECSVKLMLLSKESDFDIHCNSEPLENPIEPVLTVRRKTNNEDFPHRDFAEKLSVAMISSTTFICEDPTLTHKQKATNLFAYGALLRLKNQIDAVLWERSNFRDQLHRQISEVSTETAAPDIAHEGFLLDIAIQMHLVQAGFAITAVSTPLLLDDRMIFMAIQPGLTLVKKATA